MIVLVNGKQSVIFISLGYNLICKMKSLTSSPTLKIDYKNYYDVEDILCTQEEAIVVKEDRKINLFSNEEWEEE